MHYRGEKLGQNRGRGHRILTANECFLTFRVSNLCAKFDQNRRKIATVGARTDRQTDRSTGPHGKGRPGGSNVPVPSDAAYGQITLALASITNSLFFSCYYS